MHAARLAGWLPARHADVQSVGRAGSGAMTGDGGRPARRECVRPQPLQSTRSPARSRQVLAASAASIWRLQTHRQMRPRYTSHPRARCSMRVSSDALSGLLRPPPPKPKQPTARERAAANRLNVLRAVYELRGAEALGQGAEGASESEHGQVKEKLQVMWRGPCCTVHTPFSSAASNLKCNTLPTR